MKPNVSTSNEQEPAKAGSIFGRKKFTASNKKFCGEIVKGT